MNLDAGPPGTSAERLPTDRFAEQLERTVDRLRSLGLARLGASFHPEPTRADAARGVAQMLEDLAADLERRPARTLPRLADAAVGDQVAVCGHDVLTAAARGLEPEQAQRVAAAADALLELRRRV